MVVLDPIAIRVARRHIVAVLRNVPASTRLIEYTRGQDHGLRANGDVGADRGAARDARVPAVADGIARVDPEAEGNGGADQDDDEVPF